MGENKVQLVIEAYNKTKDAFSELDKSIKGMDDSTRKASGTGVSLLDKLKASWMGLSAAAVAAWMVIQKALADIGLGAKAMQAEDAFNKTAESMNVSASKMLDAMKEASVGTIDESHLMQKALKAMAQDVDPNKIPALFEAARVGAVKSGDDISATADMIIDAVANNMPRALRKMGLVFKDEMNIFNKAVSAGYENLNLLDLVLYNTQIQAAKMGVESYNAAIKVQKFKAETEELKENLGKGLFVILEAFIRFLQGIAGAASQAYSGISRVLQAKSALSAWSLEKMGYPQEDVDAQREKEKFWKEQAEVADAAGRDLYKKFLEPDTSGQEKTQAQLDAAAAEAEKKKVELLAQWKLKAQAKELSDARKTALDAQLEGLRKGLELQKEGYKLEAAQADEKYQSGLQSEAAFIAEKQRLDKAALDATIAELNKEKQATASAYQDMIALAAGKSTAKIDQDKLSSEKKKEIARIDGDIAKAQVDLQILAKENDIDAIKRAKELSAATREGKLKNLEAEAALAKEINQIEVQRGRMTAEEAASREYQWHIRILEAKRENLKLDLQAEGSEARRANISGEIVVIEGELAEKAIEAEKKRRAYLTKTAIGSVQLSLEDTGRDLMNLFQNIDGMVKRTFSSMTDALTEFVMTGKLNFTDFANSVIRDLVRIMIQQQVTGPLAASAGGFLRNLFTGDGSISPGYEAFHGGGMGNEPTFYRIMPNMGLLPRYHKGLGPGERMSITTDDEMTLTPGQQKRFFELAQTATGKAAQVSNNEIHVHLTVNALDSQSVSQHLARHKTEIVGMVHQAFNKIGKRGPLGK
jgi:lambda family phage tail tape measure protein